MNATVAQQIQALRATLSNDVFINNVVDILHAKMLDDYRINRFFSTQPAAAQASALKAYLKSLFSSYHFADPGVLDALDAFFTVAFARNNAKPSLVTGNDFAFLLDIVGGEESKSLKLLCPAHAYLIKLGIKDFHFDILIEHLADTLAQLNVADELAYQILALAEKARNGLMARGLGAKKAA